ncbi:unnamed protein product [Heligmosomoides polygyrus]|uniref:CNOT1_CAF1_bind domain-containing protein n=1 Tax=Heligmosomoides polygyrus TaxID=6339 RepID=A0A183G819_HELPZ|nr:unnamed protein product [Heligmosomoides polygyrus]
MTILIADAKELFNIIGLAMTDPNTSHVFESIIQNGFYTREYRRYKELFNIIGLAMTDLAESMKKSLTIVRLKSLVDIIVMSGSCNGHCTLGRVLRFLIQASFLGCLVFEGCKV